jgi:outer membrane protein OmpA-like peptidoglycan-associated protein
MRFGTPEMAAHYARAPLRLSLLLLLGALISTGPAMGQDKPTLKDVLGRVQSESETKAVEDLVDKLKGTTRKPEKPAAAPAPSPGPTATPAPAASPEAAKEMPAATPPKVALPSTPTPTSPPEAKPELKPDEAIKRAETKEAPSIDLEIFFDYKSAEVTPKAAAVLTPLGRALSDARLADDSFLIAGHTDAKGGADYNLELSQRRAESVRQFLIANFKVDAKKLIAKGYAFQHLRNPKDPFAAVNRRVQIVNLSTGQR